MKAVLLSCVSIIAILYSCAGPPILQQENGRTLGKGRGEISASYIHGESSPDIYIDNGIGGLQRLEWEHSTGSLRLRAGYGLLDNLDLKLSYGRNTSTAGYSGYGYKSEYLIMAPKWRIPGSHELALIFPVGMQKLVSPTWDQKLIKKTLYQAAVQFVGSTELTPNQAEMTASAQLHYNNGSNLTDHNSLGMGLSTGLGLSSNLDNWAIRIEAGFVLANELYGSIGGSLQFYFPRKKKPALRK